MSKQSWAAVMCLLLANLIWAGNALLARQVSGGDLQPLTMNFARWLIGAMVLLPVCGREIWQARAVWMQPAIMARLGLLAALGMGVYNSLLYASAHHTSAINIALLNTCIPLATFIVAGLILKQWPRALAWVGLFIAASGLLYLISRGDVGVLLGLQFNQGDVLMLVAVIAWAVYTVLLKLWAGQFGVSLLAMLAMMMSIAVVLMLPFASMEVIQHGLPSMNAANLAVLAYIGIAASIVSQLAWNFGVTRVGPAKASLALYTMPIFAAILSFFILGEHLKHYHLIGGGIIVAGLLLASVLGQRRA